MLTSPQILEKIECALQSVPYPQRPEGLYEPIQYVLEAGGKRIRPMLTLLAYQLYADDVDQAIPVALGLETYHNHTLLHDDLMDNADMRRNRPTVHKKWDDNTAILSGDTMLIMAFRHLLSVPDVFLRQLLDLSTHTMLEVCEGQQYDVNFESRDDVCEEEYLEMIRLKTSVLLACAAKAGSILAGAPSHESDEVYAFAEKIGLAFQLQDDYLDVYGNPRVFGKNIGGDILCGKKTFLLVNALSLSNGERKSKLLEVLNDQDMPAAEKIQFVTQQYNELGIPQLCEKAIAKYYEEARVCLDRLSVAEERKNLLWQFVASLLDRKS